MRVRVCWEKHNLFGKTFQFFRLQVFQFRAKVLEIIKYQHGETLTFAQGEREVKQNSPMARKSSLIVKELPTETLVYDLESDKAHCLNETAARVWKHCDGKRNVTQLRELMEKETGLPVPEEMVLLALDQLEKFKLLEAAEAKSFSFSGMNRREVVKRIGISALALPIIISIAAPDAQAQGSLLPPGACCNNPNQCQSNSCVQGGPCGNQPNTKSCT